MAGIGAIIGAVGAGLKIYKGIRDANEAKRQGRHKRPEYKVSERIKDTYNKSKFNAYKTGLPGENILINRIQRGTAGAVKGIKQSGASSSSIISGIAGVQANENDAYERMSLAGAQYKDRQIAEFYRQSQRLAGEERAAWDYNQNQPYQEAMATKSAMEYSRDQNIYGGVMDLGNLAVEAEALGYFARKPDMSIDPTKTKAGGDGPTASLYDDGMNRARAKRLFGDRLSERNYKLLFG